MMNKKNFTVNVNAPIDFVFDCVADSKFTPLWLENISSETVSESPVRIGTVFSSTSFNDDKPFDLIVDQMDRPNLFGMSSGNFHETYKLNQIPNSKRTLMHFCKWLDDGRMDYNGVQNGLNLFGKLIESKYKSSIDTNKQNAYFIASTDSVEKSRDIISILQENKDVVSKFNLIHAENIVQQVVKYDDVLSKTEKLLASPGDYARVYNYRMNAHNRIERNVPLLRVEKKIDMANLSGAETADVASNLLGHTLHRGLLITNSGYGAALRANAFAPLRAGVVTSPELAADACWRALLNTAAMPAKYLSVEQMAQIAAAFLTTEIPEERLVQVLPKNERRMELYKLLYGSREY